MVQKENIDECTEDTHTQKEKNQLQLQRDEMQRAQNEIAEIE